MEYNFSGPASFNPLEAYGGSYPTLKFNKKYLNLSVQKINESL